MNTKKLLIALVALGLAVPATLVAASAGPNQQQLVEGHTTYSQFVVSSTPYSGPGSTTDYGNGTAVAVYTTNETGTCPGGNCSTYGMLAGPVLWFDDTFLYNGSSGSGGNAAPTTVVSDCLHGGLWAVVSGQGTPVNPNQPPASVIVNQIEWYEIQDPSGAGNTWKIVKYQVSPINNNLTNPIIPYYEWGVQQLANGPSGADVCHNTQTVQHHAQTFNGVCTPDQPAFDIKYNALLFFWTKDLGPNTGTVQFGDNGTNSNYNTTQGNSHPYNDQYSDYGPTHTHNTYNVDLYWETYVPHPTGSPLFNQPDTPTHDTHQFAC